MNVQSLNVPVPSEIQTAPPYNRTTTKTDTEMPRSGQSSLRLIFHTIIHMRHRTYRLQNTHAIETKPHTHTHTCHRQVKFLSDRSSTQSFTCATRLTNCKIHTRSIETKPRTHVPPSGQSSLRSIFNAIIHMRHTTYSLYNTHAIETKPRTPPPSDVSECLKVMNNDLRQCLK